ncbi:hypothetical protein [Nocardioides sp. YIM 152315]|uniref:hypothetical protein n=1 Tax=Nocardioides sp. YIM 152315 TaxID=3031760 RepID=UPI0023DA0848|nr:hypothetical protein [Nocardioides sp. YIM 152315]MDF1603378.1 hypothetical protein [Nocardioides sp. YIM 152315]
MSEIDRPYVVNPEAIGDPDQTPVVQLPSEMAAYFERTRCPECRQINQTHADDCAAEDPR